MCGFGCGRDVTRLYVCHDSFICVTWFIYMYNFETVFRFVRVGMDAHVRHDSFACVTHSYVRYDSFVRVTWLIQNVWHDSFICVIHEPVSGLCVQMWMWVCACASACCVCAVWVVCVCVCVCLCVCVCVCTRSLFVLTVWSHCVWIGMWVFSVTHLYAREFTCMYSIRTYMHVCNTLVHTDNLKKHIDVPKNYSLSTHVRTHMHMQYTL